MYVDDMIETIVARMRGMGVTYSKNVKKNFKIAESDVTRASVAEMDIRNVMMHIDTYEQAIEQGELDINTIQTLSSVLYPKAIEYFSAFDNNMYNDLLNRMQSLLQREDILMVINSVSEDKPAQTDAEQEHPSSALLSMEGLPLPTAPQPEEAEKPKIDFNVSPEDLEKQEKEEEDQRKNDSDDPDEDKDPKPPVEAEPP